MTEVTARTSLRVLGALSVSHLLNDLLQALLPAVYPLLKRDFGLTFTEIGFITFTNQVTASVLQPLVGHYTDRRPQPYALVAGMTLTLSGVVLLAFAHRFAWLLVAAALVGLGSSIFHPESSRLARIASGGRHGFAQSLFQTGGNFGSSLGPLLTAFIVIPRGQSSVAWFSLFAIAGLVLLWRVSGWYAGWHTARAASRRPEPHAPPPPLAPPVRRALALLLALVFSKYVYLVSLSSYFMFFLIERFALSIESAQLYLFAFLGAVAAGTFAGGPLGDRFGRRVIIIASIVGVLPFTLALPYASLGWTAVLSVCIGLILASAFSAILVYAQELMPGRVGFVAGMFFGFAFGIAGLGAAVLGKLADWYGLAAVYRACAFLPAIGLLGLWLPRDARPSSGLQRAQHAAEEPIGAAPEPSHHDD